MKKLFTFISAIFLGVTAQAQVVGLVGDFSSWGGSPDVVMNTQDNVNWSVQTTFAITGGVKFRQDSDWAVNWGDGAFPTGVAVSGGANIPVPAGTYDVTFNSSTGDYTFSPVATGFDVIGFYGGFNGFGANVDMISTDGVQYGKLDHFFNAPDVLFRNTTTSTVYGGTAFPAGTAVVNGANIPLTVGYYNVSFNKSTLAYNFEQVPVGLIGSAIPPFDWSVDVPMTSTDGGITHYLYNYTIGDGVAKFRANNSWALNWGGPADFPADTAFVNGPDIAVAAGTYDTISFNRFTGKFNFGGSVEPGLGIKDLEKFNASAYPVPAEDLITFVADAKEFEVIITDLTGKVMMKTTSNTVNISTFATGTYLYQLRSGNKIGTGKLIKK
jgi:hypothetical protein